MKKRKCSRCNTVYPATKKYFHKSKAHKYGFVSQCKKCQKEYCNNHREEIKNYRREYRPQYYLKNARRIKKKSKLYYQNNKAAKKKYARQYRIINKEKIQVQNRLYRQTHKKEINKNFAKRRQKDLNFKMMTVLRNAIYRVLKSQASKKSNHTLILVGCTVQYFIKHIESQFLPGMTWENYGRLGWWVDHIKPCAAFDLSKEEEQRKCFHYTNLQPMWGIDNLHKSSFYKGKLFRRPKVINQSNRSTILGDKHHVL